MRHVHSTRPSRLLWPALAGALALSLQVQAQTQGQPGANAGGQPQASAGTNATSWARQQALRSSRVIGSSVRNPQGQDIGQVEDMVVNLQNGNVRFVVLRFDPGFLSFERVYAVPVERLRMVGDQVVIDIPRERLEQSGIERAGWSKDYFDDRARIARLDKDWGLGDRAPEHLVRASALMGSSIMASTTGERIGVVEEVVFAPGRQKVQYAVVRFDRGWLGDDKRVAVDIGSLHRSGGSDALALVVDRRAAQGMRPFTEDRYGHFGDGSFVNSGTRRTMGAAGSAPAR